MDKQPKGMVNFEYTKDHGTIESGFVQLMHMSTAEALVAHKIGKIEKVVAVVKKD